jgi:hypothetical protein
VDAAAAAAAAAATAAAPNVVASRRACSSNTLSSLSLSLDELHAAKPRQAAHALVRCCRVHHVVENAQAEESAKTTPRG